ncbi:MAG: phosphoribosylglycinamide formyltransferase [Acidobacteriota bacterium]
MDVKQVGILISGRGSNMVALLDAMGAGKVPARCALVVSNKPSAPGLERASERGVPTAVINHKDFPTREAHDRKILEAFREAGIEILCLAGYMRLLSPVLVEAYRNRILNIHPALLPSYTGLHAQRQALEAGVRFSGCSVHFVDEHLDHGPVILQAAVPVLPGDTEESLSSRILKYEHRLYPEALQLLCQDRVSIREGRAEIDLPLSDYRALLKGLIDLGDEE